MDDNIVGRAFKRQQIRIRYDRRTGQRPVPKFRKSGYDRWVCKGSVNLDQSFLNVSDHVIVQEARFAVMRSAGCPLAIAAQGGTVDEFRLGVHAAQSRGIRWICKQRSRFSTHRNASVAGRVSRRISAFAANAGARLRLSRVWSVTFAVSRCKAKTMATVFSATIALRLPGLGVRGVLRFSTRETGVTWRLP
jgi:hypothetical protein